MSRGLGFIQTRILDELARAPGARLPWTALKKAFPRQAAQRSLQRALRGLAARGLVYDERVGGRRYIGLTVGGDAELLELCTAVHAQLEAIARIRGVVVPDIVVPPPPRPEPRPSVGEGALRAHDEK